MRARHIFFAILISCIWGANFVVTKLGLYNFPPILFTCLRYTLIIVPLIFFIRRDSLPWSLIIKIGTSLGIFTFTLAFIGIKLGVDAGLVSLLMQLQVVFTLLLSWIILKEPPTINQSIGVLISVIGVGVLVWNTEDYTTFVGVLFVLFGALFSGITKIIMKQAGNYNTFHLMVWMSVIPPIPLLLLSFIFETNQLSSLMSISYATIFALVFNAFVSTIIGFGTLGYLIKLYSPNQIAPYAFLVPVFGILFGFLFANEDLNLVGVIASVFIFTGLVYPWVLKKITNLRIEK